MTNTASPRSANSLTARWPTALALVFAAGAITLISLLDREAEYFGPAVATMAGIYMMTYALGRPWTAWVAFAVLSVVASVLHALSDAGVWGIDPAVGMTALLVLLWLWAIARGRFTDRSTFSLETAGMVAFGAITLLCAATQPTAALVIAGLGWLSHSAWDAYHFAKDKVVNRPWSEFCCVIDLFVGTSLLIAAAV